jgi:hypothetical protein
MKQTNPQQNPPVDDFWSERVPLFTGQLPSSYNKPQQIWGRFHVSEERYDTKGLPEIIPLTHRRGTRAYVMLHPYVREPQLTMTIGLYKTPKQYADQDSAIGETVGPAKHEGFREAQIGNAQAWYYHEDKTLVLWECFLDSRFRTHPLKQDKNMRQLWQTFELWLLQRFPQATTIATPFHDPIARHITEYQAFLRMLRYSPFAEAAFGKRTSAISK